MSNQLDITELKDRLSLALQSDCEQGAAWLNEIHSKILTEQFPELMKVIGWIMDLEEDDGE